MARGNEENTPSATQNRGGAPQEHGTRKRKRVVEEGMGDEEGMKKLTSRQLALKQKVEGKEVAEALFPRTAVKQLSEEEKFKKSQQVEKRKRQKEEQMEAQKDAILRKIANAVNARSDPTAERKEKPKKRETLGEIRYVNSKSGSFLSFVPHVPVLSLDSSTTRVQKPILCVGCGNSHKYYDSKTHQPLCSLRCYQIHHQQHPLPSNGFNTLQPSPSPSPSPSLSSFQMYPQQVIAHEQGLQSSVFSPQEQLPSQGLETFA